MPDEDDSPSLDAPTPKPRDPHEDGVSRRRLLRSSAIAGAAAAESGRFVDAVAGGGSDASDGSGAPTVFVFNTGDATVSVIDATTNELVTTTYLGATASFPSNQYAPRTTTADSGALWLNVDDGVLAVDPVSLESLARVETGTGRNWVEVSPDGAVAIVSAREPAHRQFRIDADRSSDRFGEVTGVLDRSEGEGRGPRPCDVTFAPDGEHAFVPDVSGGTLTVLDVAAFEIAAQVSVPAGVEDADHARPWMATASWDGRRLAVENDEGEHGSESVWDVGEPTEPSETARLTREDGLGSGPLTSEIGPDGETAYVFTPGTEDVTVVDLSRGRIADRLDLGGEAFVGTWDPAREQLYVPVQTEDEVAVIDHEAGEVVATVAVGSRPYGATAARARPDPDVIDSLLAAVASLGVNLGAGTTNCEGRCGCGGRES